MQAGEAGVAVPRAEGAVAPVGGGEWGFEGDGDGAGVF